MIPASGPYGGAAGPLHSGAGSIGREGEPVENMTRRLTRRGREALDRIGPRMSEQRVIAEAAEYWTGSAEPAWAGNSHWRTGIPGQWEQVGRDHLALFDKLARVLDTPPSFGTVLEWGSGGGANAVAFAPRARRFVAVDVAQESLDECREHTLAACEVDFVPLLVEVENPEAAIPAVGSATCDVFLCLYVVELLPSPEYATRILRIARTLLAQGGVAFIQVKYRDSDGRTAPRRNYARNLASQTIFPIDRFWKVAAEAGFRPEALHLVPENELDRNYAYFLLSA